MRGHRIELGEVEHLLRRCLAGLTSSLAVALPKQDRLVAYCVPSAELSPAAASVLRALVRHLSAQQLPGAMRPHVVLCRALPMTSSGKLARDALPELLEQDSDTETPFQLEGFRSSVAHIWAQELAPELNSTSLSALFHVFLHLFQGFRMSTCGFRARACRWSASSGGPTSRSRLPPLFQALEASNRSVSPLRHMKSRHAECWSP